MQRNSHSMRLTVKNDYAFKLVFAGTDSKDILIDLLERLLEQEIVDLEYLSGELRKEYSRDKYGVLDIKVKLSTGELVNIEIQLQWLSEMPERSFYYLSKMYHGSIREGESYSLIPRCITINIVERHFTLNELFISRYRMLEETTYEAMFDKADVYFVNLAKLVHGDYGDTDEGLIQWFKFINSEDEEERKMLAETSMAITKANAILEKIPMNPAQREEYLSREKAIRDKAMYEENRDRRIAEALEEGIKKGRAEGIETGRAEGILVVAAKMKAAGISVEEIMHITQLDRDVIASL